ncbi:outer membrane protein assembly factor BamE [Paenibacillus mesophilus]|uniref:outer membrane protein assembly factor BamE n=1 Tax=Paenibacillus mesophilus TaxID=2582849 RepID=UPI00110F52FA|nr:outer membrane protein assembly factor BamE [Paenibacillus mesophilus]TMV44126.1 outer membrane protein assembly factor BamE [Paenibacillus mesophilus]
MDPKPKLRHNSKAAGRVVRNLALIIGIVLAGLLLLVATRWKQPLESEKGTLVFSSSSAQVQELGEEQRKQEQREDNDVLIVKNGREVGNGPLSPIYTSLGGIRIGDTQEQVLALLGEPSERTQARSTPYPQWYYKNHDLYILFYRNGENEPAGGAVSIRISEQSALKLNDRRAAPSIAIGDGLERLLELYRPIAGTAGDGTTRNFWIRGSELGVTGFYKPVVQILMKEGRITNITLENEDDNPSQ